MNTFLSVRIDESTNHQLKAIASQENVTKTTIIKSALDLYLKNRYSKLTNQISILYQLEDTEI